MYRILLVDDELDILKVMKKYLQADYVVLTAANGLQAIDICSKERPDVIVTDIRMPGMDGIELIRRIRQVDLRVEIVAITGHGDERITEESLRAGASDCLVKPVDLALLEDCIAGALSRLKQRHGVA